MTPAACLHDGVCGWCTDVRRAAEAGISTACEVLLEGLRWAGPTLDTSPLAGSLRAGAKYPGTEMIDRALARLTPEPT